MVYMYVSEINVLSLVSVNGKQNRLKKMFISSVFRKSRHRRHTNTREQSNEILNKLGVAQIFHQISIYQGY